MRTYRWLLRAFLGSLLILVMARVDAKDITVTCSAPKQFEDGSAIPAGTSITFKFYAASKGATKVLVGTKSACSYVHTNAPVGSNCFEATATIAGIESKHTSEVCSDIAPPAPNAPGDLKATQTPIAPTAYSVIKSAEELVMIPVGTVKLDAACDVTQTLQLKGTTYNAVATSAVTFTGTARPIVAFAICG